MEIQVYKHKIQYYETDQMGVVHHSNYIRWMEEARVDLMDQLGVTMTQIEDMGMVIPVVSISCEYRTMARFGETVEVYLKLKSYNGIKLFFDYVIKDCTTGETRLTASSSHCFLTKEGKLISLKKSYPEIHQIFEAYQQTCK